MIQKAFSQFVLFMALGAVFAPAHVRAGCNIDLISASQLSADMIKAEADFIHSVWQRSNSYRTRYKAMKSEYGLPITDIQAYIEARQIPMEYRIYYRQNTKGAYEEDIKYIPNKYLAPNNAKENIDGAESYLRNLGVLSSSSNRASAMAAIEDALRAIHSEWYERNSSWTVPYGEPKTYDEADVEKQYNGAIQFYMIAERQGLLQNAVLKRAFAAFVQDLARKKFAPYKSMDAVKAFLEITHRTGAKPSITGDRHMAQFFAGRLKRYSFQIPKVKNDEAKAVADFITRYFSTINQGQALAIKAPPVPPGSEARIFLIVDASESQRGLLAVLKVQNGVSGLDEIVSSMAAEEQISPSQDFTPVKTVAAGRLLGGDYFLLQQAAKTVEADRYFGFNHLQRREMVRKVAKSLVALHGRFQIYNESQAKELSADFTTFRGNCFYDVRALRGFLHGGTRDVFSPAKASRLVSESESKAITERIQATLTAYSALIELSPELLSPAVIHGDFHGGNLFINSASDRTMLIDFAGATWFIGKRSGTGDRGNDLGRMLGNIIVEGTRHQLAWPEIAALMAELVATYKVEAGLPQGSAHESAFDTSARLYMNRFLAVNAADSAGKKFKPLAGDRLPSLRRRLFVNWARAAE